MAQIPIWNSGTGIKFSDIYNVVNRIALGTPVPSGTGVDISDFAGQTWEAPGITVPGATAGADISIKKYFSGNKLPGGGDYPGDSKPVNSFDTIALNEKTHRCNFKVEYTDKALPFYFTDSGGGEDDYYSNDNYYVTFYSPTGLRFWIHAKDKKGTEFNYFDFEEFTYSQYDRLGIQVSNSNDEDLENFQSTTASGKNLDGSVLYPWLQTSSNKTPPWSSSFGGGRFDSSRSQKGYIFPSNTRRAERLELEEGVALDLNFKVIRFYFSADGSSEERGWYFSVYPLS